MPGRSLLAYTLRPGPRVYVYGQPFPRNLLLLLLQD